MGLFELWLKACEEDKTSVCMMEDDGKGTTLYKTWTNYLNGRDTVRTRPVYHVWQGDGQRYCV